MSDIISNFMIVRNLDLNYEYDYTFVVTKISRIGYLSKTLIKLEVL